ncbi:hypothetical protein [Francisella tularensis]|uniref:hypothetical protein n=1 Tax=Francisella tularensis TaxID=263 RepID=UPI0008F4791A|nr:hypothetical protein [Francisella tularensis]APA82060.1 hypothetical protein N894_0076 [Francisella tularensis subsp. novicida PA10-7858]
MKKEILATSIIVGSALLTSCIKQKSQTDVDIPVTLTLQDSIGDGWDGGQTMTLINQDSGESFGPYTCVDENECVINVTLTGPAQYQVNVTDGAFSNEISWIISGQSGVLISAYAPNAAPYSGTFNLT